MPELHTITTAGAASSAPAVVSHPRPTGRAPRPLPVAGYVPLSTTDWPGVITATVFTQGCPLACTYCHNPSLIDTRTPGAVPWEQVLAFLGRRVGLLDGVVFSGGEPTLHPQLVDAVRQAAELGFPIGLHTAGMWPRRVHALLPYLSWVGLDIKATPGGYPALTGSPVVSKRVAETLTVLAGSGIDFEVRTTVVPGVHTLADVTAVHEQVTTAGARHVLQAVRTIGTREDFADTQTGRAFGDVIPDDALPTALRRIV